MTGDLAKTVLGDRDEYDGKLSQDAGGGRVLIGAAPMTREGLAPDRKVCKCNTLACRQS